MNNMDWDKAEKHLDFIINLYESIGIVGTFGLPTLRALKKRLDSGERTKELYDEIMDIE